MEIFTSTETTVTCQSLLLSGRLRKFHIAFLHPKRVYKNKKKLKFELFRQRLLYNCQNMFHFAIERGKGWPMSGTLPSLLYL